MEQLTGKQQMMTGTLTINGSQYRYEEYLDPNRPHNRRTIVIYRPGHDTLIFEYDTERDVLQKMVEKLL